MPQNFSSIPFDVYSAALLYSLGKLSIGEAAKIAANFSCTRDNSNANFHILQHKVRQVPAIFAIVALAQGLTQDSSDWPAPGKVEWRLSFRSGVHEV